MFGKNVATDRLLTCIMVPCKLFKLLKSIDYWNMVTRAIAERISSKFNKTNLHGGSKQSIAFNQNISAAVQ